MKDIQEFLRARYNEELKALRGWSAKRSAGQFSHAEIVAATTVVDLLPHDQFTSHEVDAFNLRLADIDAKLKIVGLYTYVSYNDDDEPYFCGSGEETWYETLCLLALPYAEHADYDQRWRPADV